MLSLLATVGEMSEALRRALLSESETAETGVLPPNLLLDFSLLHREIVDSTGRTLRDRLGSSHGLMEHHGKTLGEPSLLVDLAFSHPDGFEATHSKTQQEAQRWLFDRCRRLPSKLRQECVQRLASAAAQSHSNALNRMARIDIVTTLALNKRQTYLVEVAVPAAQEAEELASATASAGSDGALQALLKLRTVLFSLSQQQV